MALTTEQKSSRLFKKLFNKSETLVGRDYFEEPIDGRSIIYPSQIWSEQDKIPNTAPILSNGQIDGVVQYFEKLELQHIPGSNNLSYYNSTLKYTIPFNYGGNVSYGYKLYKNDGTTVIPDGQGNWMLDNDTGVLTFYPEVSNPLPTGVNESTPPKISFYKYVGATGFTYTSSGDTITLPSNFHEIFDAENSGTTSQNNIVAKQECFIFPSGYTVDLNTVEIHMNGTLYSYGISQGNSAFYTNGIPVSGCTLYFDGSYTNINLELTDSIDLKFSTYGTDGSGTIITNEQGELNRYVSESRAYVISGNTDYIIPFTYEVGKHQIDVQIDNNMLVYGIDWVEVGTSTSDKIQFTYDIFTDWVIVIRKFAPVLNTYGVNNTISIEDINNNIHTLIFENGLLKSYNIT
mgnify:CR=1 FL=1